MKKSEALKILGLADGATDDEVKKAHREKVIENHPDKFAQDPVKKASAEEETKKINEARDVLLSRKWEPEFGRGTAGYGSPFDPFSGYPRGGSTTAGDPFAGWPFGGQGQAQGGPAYVWTSWDTTADSSPFNPFGSSYVREQTPAEKRDEALSDLKQDMNFIVIKLVLAALLCAGQMFGGALLAYALLTVVYALFKRYGSCLLVALIPLVMVVAPMAVTIARLPIVALIMIPFAAGALIYDGWSLFKSYRAYRAAKKKAETT